MSLFHNNNLLGASSQGYQIERSLRFNSSDSAYLSRTPASAGNRKTWTWAGWVKRSALPATATYPALFASGSTSINFYDADSTLFFYDAVYAGFLRVTSSKYRDPAAWYHIVCVLDTTQATAASRVRFYINGVEVSSFAVSNDPTQNADLGLNQATSHQIGAQTAFGDRYFDGYLADVHFIDGQALTPSSFGEFDTNGVWQPIAYTGSYGTNGFHLPFSDNSTAAALGTDTSGNSNTWTVNNLSVAAGAGNDSLVDSPTNYGTDTGAGGEVRGNYATLNPLAKGGTHALSNGNLDFSMSGSSGSTSTFGTIGVSSGKWYWEMLVTSVTALYYPGIGVETNPNPAVQSGSNTTGFTYLNTGEKLFNSSLSAYGASFTTNDIISVALDMDAGTLVFYKNGASQGELASGITGTAFPVIIGQLPCSGSLNFGQRPFAYTAPSGFKALCTANLPEPTIADGSTAMDVKLYTGSNNTNTITGLGFSPDFVWIKARSSALNNILHDTVRGRGYGLYSNLTNAEPAVSAAGTDLVSFDSNGFTLGANYNFNVNDSGVTFAAWTWDAGSSTVTNTQGSITSQVRANASAGFSVVTLTSPTGTGNFSAGHGLGVTPEFVIVKSRDAVGVWYVYHKSLATDYYLRLNGTNAAATDGVQWGAGMTSSVLGLRASYSTVSGATTVAYAFAPVAGYSSFGSVVGNGSADNAFCYTGFRPRFILLKQADQASAWALHDTARAPYNAVGPYLLPNTSDAEASVDQIDFLSNGFKLRNSGFNNGSTWIYAAFAEHPFSISRAR